MKNILKKTASFLEKVFGYGILISLFAGGFTFFGFVIALIIGGNTATLICKFIYIDFFPVIIKLSTIMVLMGLLIMYLRGEKALTSDKNKKKV